MFQVQSRYFQHDGQCRIEYGVPYESGYIFCGVCLLGFGRASELLFFLLFCSFLVFVVDGDYVFFVCVDGDVHGSQQEAWRSTELAFESRFWVDQVMVIVRYVR